MAEDEIIYPCINENKENVLEYNPEHFVTGKGYFFSPGFRTCDIIIENILKGYEGTGGKSVAHFWNGKLIFKQWFSQDKDLNEILSSNINQINKAKDSNLKINDVVAVCKDRASDSVFLLTGSKLYAVIQNKNDNVKEYYIVSLTEIFVKNNGIDYVNGESLIKDNDLNNDFINFARELKALCSEVNIDGCYHPMREKLMEQRKVYISILVDRCILDGYLTVNEASRLEKEARLLGISSFDMLKIINSSIKNVKKDKIKYIGKSLKKAENLEETSRCLLLHDLMVMDYMDKEKISLEEIPKYTKKYIEYYKFNSIQVLKYKKAILEYMENFEELKDVLFQGQMLAGDRQICERFSNSVKFKYDMPKPLQ